MFFSSSLKFNKYCLPFRKKLNRLPQNTYKKPVADIAQTLDAEEPCSYLYITPAPTCVYITRSGIYVYNIHVYIHTHLPGHAL
jgi:hypothetical protein